MDFRLKGLLTVDNSSPRLPDKDIRSRFRRTLFGLSRDGC